MALHDAKSLLCHDTLYLPEDYQRTRNYIQHRLFYTDGLLSDKRCAGSFREFQTIKIKAAMEADRFYLGSGYLSEL